MPGPTPDRTSYRAREEAAAGIRELFEHGLAERGEFYIVERDEQGNVLSVFDVDDEVVPPTAITGTDFREETDAAGVSLPPGSP